jgi:hypothetical protein
MSEYRSDILKRLEVAHLLTRIKRKGQAADAELEAVEKWGNQVLTEASILFGVATGRFVISSFEDGKVGLIKMATENDRRMVARAGWKRIRLDEIDPEDKMTDHEMMAVLDAMDVPAEYEFDEELLDGPYLEPLLAPAPAVSEAPPDAEEPIMVAGPPPEKQRRAPIRISTGDRDKIRSAVKRGATQASQAALYGVSSARINQIVHAVEKLPPNILRMKKRA